MKRLVILVLALAALAGCGPFDMLRTGRPPLRPPGREQGATPIPPAPSAPPWTAGELRGLQTQLRRALGASALATSGIAIVDAQGRPLFARRDRSPMTPASTMKLLIASTALQTLGPDFRFTTTFEATIEPHDGTLPGNLYLVGSGDPTLTRDDLRAGVAALAHAGITKVTGDLVADAAAFSGPEINPGWDPGDLQYGYAAGTSALSLDQGTVELRVVAGAPGAPARIHVFPPSDAVRVRGPVLTGYGTSISIVRAPDRNDFTFSGSVAAGAQPSFWQPVVGLPLYAAAVARTMLRSRGIAIAGSARTGIAPVAPDVLWRHRSAPLRQILRTMLFESNNHFAEQLLRAVGGTRGAGTEENGALVERAVLTRAGAPQNGLRILDGSGLAPGDRVAPLTLATLLARTAAQPGGTLFVDALPRAGIEGTVRWHNLTDALGKVHAKSGHIENVNALAGYVDTRRHGRLAFAVIVNDRRADAAAVYAGIDKALDILARS